MIVAQMNKPLRAAQTFAPPPAKAAVPETPPAADGAMNIEQIMKMLPHRPPFLLVDRVLKLEGNKIVAVKNVTINEPFFQGHFPAHPVMPGVLQLEAIAQVAGIVLIKQGETVNQVAYFMSAEDVKWRKPVVPGDVLIIEVELTKVRGKIGKANGVCKVAGEIVSEAEVTFMIRDL
jgi:UDP-3-O-[3-hydroxymyristoyl] N-acetylglucosamine deacetylase/3-hydroxyacyl-[acyl-carrier-protein] dehydratase